MVSVTIKNLKIDLMWKADCIDLMVFLFVN